VQQKPQSSNKSITLDSGSLTPQHGSRLNADNDDYDDNDVDVVVIHVQSPWSSTGLDPFICQQQNTVREFCRSQVRLVIYSLWRTTRKRPRTAACYSVATDVIAIAQRYGFQVHSYADDTQLYYHDKAESRERRLPRFTECIAATETRMTANRLKINTNKTDFIWLGSKHQLAKIKSQSITLEAVHVPVSSVVTCPEVQFDSQLTFIPHVQCLARRCFCHLRQPRSVRRTLTTDSAKALMHALIGSRLDYFNSKLYQIDTTAIKTLQSVLHSAARLNAEAKVLAHNTDTSR